MAEIEQKAIGEKVERGTQLFCEYWRRYHMETRRDLDQWLGRLNDDDFDAVRVLGINLRQAATDEKKLRADMMNMSE